MEAALTERRQRREALLDKARAFVREVAGSVDLVAAAVYGSVARGDFNVWSDIDLLVIVPPFPAGAAGKAAWTDFAPPGVQVLVWTTSDFLHQLGKDNAIAREVLARGEIVYGDDALRALAGTPGR